MLREVADRPRPQNWSLWSLNRNPTGGLRNTYKEGKLSGLKYVNNTKEKKRKRALNLI